MTDKIYFKEPSVEVKDQSIIFKVSPKQKNLLKEKAKKMNTTPSQLIRYELFKENFE